MKVKSKSEVTQLCLISSNPMDCSPPGSSVHVICQARVLEWVVIAFSKLFTVTYKFLCSLELHDSPTSPAVSILLTLV